jgi:hypothetical protein
MLTKVLTLVLVVLIGLALGVETARMVHAHATGVDVTCAVNIHHALGFGLLATAGALLLSLRADRRGGLRFGAWLSRQWSRFTTWLELTLNGLFGFDAFDVVLRGDDAKRLLVSLKNHASPEEMARRRQISRERLANPTVTLPGTPEYEACAQDALDDAAKTACTSCSTLGHWSPDCPASRIRAHPSAAEDGECDGSGRYLPNTEAERQR